MTSQSVKDVSAADFDADVIDASFEKPIVVDFWAPWCGPCRQLGPVLEKLAGQAEGAWTLVKIDIDENPSIAARYGVQSIPAVKAFRDGKVAAQFVGAQPEAVVSRFVTALKPTVAEQRTAEAGAHVEGDPTAAEALYREALASSPDFPPALLGLGALLAAAGRDDEALAALDAIGPRRPEFAAAAPIKARLHLAAEGVGGGVALDAAHTVLERDPRDPAANLAVGRALAASGDYAAALAHLLVVVERDKTFEHGAARTDMLAIFDLLGVDAPLTMAYRRKLASALYA